MNKKTLIVLNYNETQNLLRKGNLNIKIKGFLGHFASIFLV